MHNASQIWIRFTGISLLAHLIVLALIFFVYNDGVQHLAFIITPRQTQRELQYSIVFEQPKPAMKAPAKKAAPVATKKTVPAKPAAPAKKATEQPQKKAQEKEPVKKEAEKKVPDHLDLALSKNKSMQPFEQEFTLLYKEVADHWAPPAGVPAESSCMIAVSIDRAGEIDDMDIVTSSGMFIFDLAARRALSEIAFPKFVWGKSITITFSL